MTTSNELLGALVAIEAIRLALHLYDRARFAWSRRPAAPQRKRQL